MILSGTSDLVRIVTSGSNIDLQVQASWADQTTTAFTPGRTNTLITSATTTTVVGSPAASTQRSVHSMKIVNEAATDQVDVVVIHTDGSTVVSVYKTTLLADEQIQYDGKVFDTFDRLGIRRSVATLSTRVVVQTFDEGIGTYLPSIGMKSCIVIGTGGGAGGGGADTDGTSGASGAGGGGGAGASGVDWFMAAEIAGIGETVTVGAGGAGGAGAAGANGSNGGETSFGSLMTIPGGLGGIGSGAAAVDFSAKAGGAGGAAPTDCTVNIAGGNGGTGFATSPAALSCIGVGGHGGASLWGGGAHGGGVGVASLTTDATSVGVAATQYGAGGSGAVNLNSTTNVDGGAGFAGVLVVIEFI